MNILIFVTVMMMIMATMTYGRFYSYILFSAQRDEWSYFMKESERSELNRLALVAYKGTTKTTSNQDTDQTDETNQQETPGTPPGTAPQTPQTENPIPSATTPTTTGTQNVAGAKLSGRISFKWFLNKETRQNSPTEFQLNDELTVALMQVLYGNQPYFLGLAQQRPNLFNDVLTAVMAAADTQGSDELKTYKKTSYLIYLPISDVDLSRAFYAMLIEAPSPVRTYASPQKGIVWDDQSEEDYFASEEHSPAGFYSLQDFITMKENPKISVYLAPRMLLLAIFQNPDIVNNILTTRYQLYCQVRKKSNPLDPQAAAKQFQDQFGNSSQHFAPILDFSVSKTNPKLYE
jgi:hypothetical protein